MARPVLMSVAILAFLLSLAPLASAATLDIDAASEAGTTITLPSGTFSAATVSNINGKKIVASRGFRVIGALTFPGIIQGAARIELSDVEVSSIAIGGFTGTGAGTAAGPLISIKNTKVQAMAGLSVGALTGSVDVVVQDNEFRNGAQLTFAAVGATGESKLATVSITGNTFKAPATAFSMNWYGVNFPSTVQSLKALVVTGNTMPAAPSRATAQFIATAALSNIGTVTVADNEGTCSAATCKAFTFGAVTFVSALTVSRNTYTGASSANSGHTLTFAAITNVDTVAVDGNTVATTQAGSGTSSINFGALLHGSSLSVSGNVISVTGTQYAYAGYVGGAVTNWTSVTFKGGSYTARTTSSWGANAVFFYSTVNTVDALTLEGLTASATSQTSYTTRAPHYSGRAVHFYSSVLNVKTFSIIHCDASAVAPYYAYAVGVLGVLTNVEVLNITGRGGGVKAAPVPGPSSRSVRTMSVGALKDEVTTAEQEAAAAVLESDEDEHTADTERTAKRVVSALAGTAASSATLTTVSASAQDARAVHFEGAMTNVKTIVVRGIKGSLGGGSGICFVKLGSSITGGSAFADPSVPLSTDENSIVFEDLGFTGTVANAAGSIIVGSGGTVSFFKKIEASSIKLAGTQTTTSSGSGFRMLYFTGAVSHVANNVTFTDVAAASTGYSSPVVLYVSSFNHVGGVSVTHTTLVTTARAGTSIAFVVAGNVAYAGTFHASDILVVASAKAASTSVMCINGAYTHSGDLTFDRITARASATQHSHLMNFGGVVSNVSSISLSHMDTASHANASWGGRNVMFYGGVTDVGSISVEHSTIVATAKTSYTTRAPHYSARAVTFYSGVAGLGSLVVKDNTISASGAYYAYAMLFNSALSRSGTIVVQRNTITATAVSSDARALSFASALVAAGVVITGNTLSSVAPTTNRAGSVDGALTLDTTVVPAYPVAGWDAMPASITATVVDAKNAADAKNRLLFDDNTVTGSGAAFFALSIGGIVADSEKSNTSVVSFSNNMVDTTGTGATVRVASMIGSSSNIGQVVASGNRFSVVAGNTVNIFTFGAMAYVTEVLLQSNDVYCRGTNAMVVGSFGAMSHVGLLRVADSSLTALSTTGTTTGVLRFDGAVTDADTLEFDNVTIHARAHSQYAYALSWQATVANVKNISVNDVRADTYTNSSWGAYIGQFYTGVRDVGSISFNKCRFWTRSHTTYTTRAPHYSARVIHFYSTVTRLSRFSVTNCVCHADAAYHAYLLTFAGIAGIESFIVENNVLSTKERSANTQNTFVTSSITGVPRNFTLSISRNQFTVTGSNGLLRLAGVESVVTGDDATLWSPSEAFTSPSSVVSEPGLYFLENTFTLAGSATTNGFIVGVIGLTKNVHCMVMADNNIAGTLGASTSIMSAKGGVSNLRNVTVRDSSVSVTMGGASGHVLLFGAVSNLESFTVERCAVSISTGGGTSKALAFSGAVTYVDEIRVVDTSLRATTVGATAAAFEVAGLLSNCEVLHMANTQTFASATSHHALAVYLAGGVSGLRVMNLTNVTGTTNTGGWGSRAMYFYNKVQNMTSLLMADTTFTATAKTSYTTRAPYYSARAVHFYSGVADVGTISLRRSTVTATGAYYAYAFVIQSGLSNVGLLEIQSSTISAKATHDQAYAVDVSSSISDLTNFHVVNSAVTAESGANHANAIHLSGTANRMYAYYVGGNTVRVKAKTSNARAVFNTGSWAGAKEYVVVSNGITLSGTSGLRSVGINGALSVGERVFVSGNSISLTATAGDGHVGYFGGLNHLKSTMFIGNRVTARCTSTCGIFQIASLNNVSTLLLDDSTLSAVTTGASASVLYVPGAMQYVASFYVANSTLESQATSHYAYTVVVGSTASDFGCFVVENSTIRSRSVSGWGAMAVGFRSTITNGGHVNVSGNTIDVSSKTSYTTRAPHYSARAIYVYSTVTGLKSFHVVGNAATVTGAYYVYAVAVGGAAVNLSSIVVKGNTLAVTGVNTDATCVRFWGAITNAHEFLIADNSISVQSTGGADAVHFEAVTFALDALNGGALVVRGTTITATSPGGVDVITFGALAHAKTVLMEGNKATVVATSGSGVNLMQFKGSLTDLDQYLLLDSDATVTGNAATVDVAGVVGLFSHCGEAVVKGTNVVVRGGSTLYAFRYGSGLSHVRDYLMSNVTVDARSSGASTHVLYNGGALTHGRLFAVKNSTFKVTSQGHYASYGDIAGAITNVSSGIVHEAVVVYVASTTGWGATALQLRTAITDVGAINVSKSSFSLSARTSYTTRAPYYSCRFLDIWGAVKNLQTYFIADTAVTTSGAYYVYTMMAHAAWADIGSVLILDSSVSATAKTSDARTLTFAADIDRVEQVRVVGNDITASNAGDTTYGVFFADVRHSAQGIIVAKNTINVPSAGANTYMVRFEELRNHTNASAVDPLDTDSASSAVIGASSSDMAPSPMRHLAVSIYDNVITATARSSNCHALRFDAKAVDSDILILNNTITVRGGAQTTGVYLMDMEGSVLVAAFNTITATSSADGGVGYRFGTVTLMRRFEVLHSDATVTAASSASAVSVVSIVHCNETVLRFTNLTVSATTSGHHASCGYIGGSITDTLGVAFDSITCAAKSTGGWGARAVYVYGAITNVGNFSVSRSQVEVSAKTSYTTRAPYYSARAMYMYSAITKLSMLAVVDSTFSVAGAYYVYGAVFGSGATTIDHLVLRRNRVSVSCSATDARAVNIFGSSLGSRSIVVEDNAVTVSGAGSSFVGLEFGGVVAMSSTPSSDFSDAVTMVPASSTDNTVSFGSLPEKTVLFRRNTVTLSTTGSNVRAVNVAGAINSAAEVELSENTVTIRGKGTNKAAAFVGFTHSDSVLIADNKVSVSSSSGATTGVSAGALTYVKKFSMVRNELSAPSTGAQIDCAAFGAITNVDEFEVAGLTANVASSVAHVFLLNFAGVVSHGKSFAVRDVHAPTLSATQYSYGIVFNGVIQNWTSYFLVDNVTADVRATSSWGAHFVRFYSTVQNIAELNVSRVSGTVYAKTSYTTRAPHYSARGLEFVSAVTGVTAMNIIGNAIACNGAYYVYCGNVHGRVTAMGTVRFVGNSFAATATASDARALNIGDFDAIKTVIIAGNTLSSRATSSRSYGGFFTDVTNVETMMVRGNTITASGPTTLRALFFQTIARCGAVVVDGNTAKTKDTASTSYAMTIGAITHTPRVAVTNNNLQAQSTTSSHTVALFFSSASDNSSFIDLEGNTFEVTASKTASNYALWMATSFKSARIEMRRNTFKTTGTTAAALVALPTSLTDVDVVFADNTMVSTVAPFRTTVATGSGMTLFTRCNTVQGSAMASSVFTARFTASAVTSSTTGACGTCSRSADCNAATTTGSPTFTASKCVCTCASAVPSAPTDDTTDGSATVALQCQAFPKTSAVAAAAHGPHIAPTAAVTNGVVAPWTHPTVASIDASVARWIVEGEAAAFPAVTHPHVGVPLFAECPAVWNITVPLPPFADEFAAPTPAPATPQPTPSPTPVPTPRPPTPAPTPSPGSNGTSGGSASGGGTSGGGSAASGSGTGGGGSGATPAPGGSGTGGSGASTPGPGSAGSAGAGSGSDTHGSGTGTASDSAASGGDGGSGTSASGSAAGGTTPAPGSTPDGGSGSGTHGGGSGHGGGTPVPSGPGQGTGEGGGGGGGGTSVDPTGNSTGGSGGSTVPAVKGLPRGAWGITIAVPPAPVLRGSVLFANVTGVPMEGATILDSVYVISVGGASVAQDWLDTEAAARGCAFDASKPTELKCKATAVAPFTFQVPLVTPSMPLPSGSGASGSAGRKLLIVTTTVRWIPGPTCHCGPPRGSRSSAPTMRATGGASYPSSGGDSGGAQRVRIKSVSDVGPGAASVEGPPFPLRYGTTYWVHGSGLHHLPGYVWVGGMAAPVSYNSDGTAEIHVPQNRIVRPAGPLTNAQVRRLIIEAQVTLGARAFASTTLTDDEVVRIRNVLERQLPGTSCPAYPFGLDLESGGVTTNTSTAAVPLSPPNTKPPTVDDIPGRQMTPPAELDSAAPVPNGNPSPPNAGAAAGSDSSASTTSGPSTGSGSEGGEGTSPWFSVNDPTTGAVQCGKATLAARPLRMLGSDTDPAECKDAR